MSETFKSSDGCELMAFIQIWQHAVSRYPFQLIDGIIWIYLFPNLAPCEPFGLIWIVKLQNVNSVWLIRSVKHFIVGGGARYHEIMLTPASWNTLCKLIKSPKINARVSTELHSFLEVRWCRCLDALWAVLVIACNNCVGRCCSRQTDDRLIRFPAQVVWRDSMYDGNLRASPEESQAPSSVIKGSKLRCWREVKTNAEHRRCLANSSAEVNYMTCSWEICICSTAVSSSPKFSLFYLLFSVPIRC